MSVLSDLSIIDLCKTETPMIEPFVDHSVRLNDQGEKIPSYGLSSYGYDVRLAPLFEVFKDTNPPTVIDPCNPPEGIYEQIEGESAVIPPHGYMLAHTLEYIRVPRDVIITCLTKSTYARLGIMINVTPLEPGWEGQLVVEIANLTNHFVKITAGVGIAQFVFHKGDQPCKVAYSDRNGKYQKQTGIRHAE